MNRKVSELVALPSVVLDYSVLDHLQRIEAGSYVGTNKEGLRKLYYAGTERRIVVWISEISDVEMLHGIENLTDRMKREQANRKDDYKRKMAHEMGAKRLGYPCSKFDDPYSRWDVSFRFAGPNSESASFLENKLEQVKGISRGDARQLVSCAYPFDGDNVDFTPHLDWFVSEDQALVRSVRAEIRSGRLFELESIRFGTAKEFAIFLDENR